MGDHARLAPSASERWINCPISVHLSEGFEDTKSIYAAEGTLAHKLAELKIKDDLLKEKVDFTSTRNNELYDQEMEEHTDNYLEHIRAIYSILDDVTVIPEVKLDLSNLIEGECFGTADCVLLAENELHVFDFKYGKNVEVNAKDNTQLRLYALGAYYLYSSIYNINYITTHIIQPRMNNFSSESLTVKELDNWLEQIVKPAASDATTNNGKPKRGPWCKFCKAKAICRAYGKQFEEIPNHELPPKISNKEVAYRITRLEGVDSYLKELKDYALNQLLNGYEIPGYKVVEGRSTRVWSDEKKAFDIALSAGYSRNDLYEEKPLSLSKLEKHIGKKKFNQLLGEFVEKPIGKPTLVKTTDKREPIRRQSALEDFKEIEV